MSAFCVFGMTEPLAKRLATDAEAKRPLEDRKSQSEDERQEWIAKKAADILEKGKSRQVSPGFDAPQFCHDWIGLAKSTANAKRLKVMVRGEKGQARRRNAKQTHWQAHDHLAFVQGLT